MYCTDRAPTKIRTAAGEHDETMSTSSWLGLARKTAIVTGSGSGIGAAVTKSLIQQHGCSVVAVDTNSERLAAMMKDSALIRVTCDVSKEDQVIRLFQQHPEASILVNCAGITRDSMFTAMKTDQWKEVMDVNLFGSFLTCREFLRTTSPEVYRSIVNVGSVVSEQGNVGQANYAASKGGVLGLTRALAKEYATKNVRVNAVVPGFIDTEMVQAVPDKVKEKILPKISMRRYGTAEDVANLILFLASEERSGFVTGECLECSGMISL